MIDTIPQLENEFLIKLFISECKYSRTAIIKSSYDIMIF